MHLGIDHFFNNQFCPKLFRKTIHKIKKNKPNKFFKSFLSDPRYASVTGGRAAWGCSPIPSRGVTMGCHFTAPSSRFPHRHWQRKWKRKEGHRQLSLATKRRWRSVPSRCLDVNCMPFLLCAGGGSGNHGFVQGSDTGFPNAVSKLINHHKFG